MQDYQREFIELAIRVDALSFGEYTLKSGRVSPYFFNAGKFQTGAALALLGRAYAGALSAADVEFDMLFGPAYKGIPIVSVTAAALHTVHGRDLPYCYNRKEAKAHGEGGTLVGAPLSGRVAIVDDVITAGTAIREVLSIMDDSPARPAVIVVGLDRQERGQGPRSAIEELAADTGVPVISIVTLADVMRYLDIQGEQVLRDRIDAYRQRYGIDQD